MREKMNIINICTAVNSKYARYLYVMLFSLFESNDDKIDVYILQADLTECEKCYLNELAGRYHNKILFIDVDVNAFEDELPKDEHFSIETYFRLMMPELLTKINRVLYLDVDIIIQGNINSLYNIDLNGNIMAVCQDMLVEYLDEEYQRRFKRYGHIPYFNAGVVLYDLGKLREKYTFFDFMDAARELNFDLPYVDQDILNYLFYDQVKWIDRHKYNYMPASDRGERLNDISFCPTIIHFAGVNPWAAKKEPTVSQLWWKYAKKTKWYIDFLEEYVLCLERKLREEWYLREQSNLILRITEQLNKENIEIVLADIFNNVTDDFGIYGAGYYAEKFYKILEKTNLNTNLKIVIDRDKKGDFHGLPIMSNFNFVDNKRNYIIVVTPTYDLGYIMKDIHKKVPLNVKVISLVDFIDGRI